MRIPRPLAATGIALGFLLIEILFTTDGESLLYDGIFVLGAICLEREIDRSLPDFSRAAYYLVAGALASGAAAMSGRDWFPAFIFASLCFMAWLVRFALGDPTPRFRRPS
jgi:hypothetical protein